MSTAAAATSSTTVDLASIWPPWRAFTDTPLLDETDWRHCLLLAFRPQTSHVLVAELLHRTRRTSTATELIADFAKRHELDSAQAAAAGVVVFHCVPLPRFTTPAMTHATEIFIAWRLRSDKRTLCPVCAFFHRDDRVFLRGAPAGSALEAAHTATRVALGIVRPQLIQASAPPPPPPLMSSSSFVTAPPLPVDVQPLWAVVYDTEFANNDDPEWLPHSCVASVVAARQCRDELAAGSDPAWAARLTTQQKLARGDLDIMPLAIAQ